VLDDGTSQIYETTYNSQGSPLTKTDPLGRQTTYDYAVDGVTLTAVRQTTGGINDRLVSAGNFDGKWLPQTTTDASGQTTTLTYNSAGNPLSVTNSVGQTVSYGYDSDGRLTRVSGPVSGTTTTYSHDAYGRQRSITSEGYTVTTDYDQFDRPIRITHPDGSYEERTYDRLDLASRLDRTGRLTRFYHDALRRLTAIRDSSGLVTSQEWCSCGSREAVTDARGNKISWEWDLQGRLTQETRADGATSTTYTYEAKSGRLSSVVDPKGQIVTYRYALDNQRLSTAFTNATRPTADVAYTYDPHYGRLQTQTDGIGITTYTYRPAGSAGAGEVETLDGPLADDLITYGYDALGRVTARTLNGNVASLEFDSLGRVTSQTNVLGTFAYSYDQTSTRLTTVTYPNGQMTTYDYRDRSQGHRLRTLHNKSTDGSTLSRYDYTHDLTGNVLTWRQETSVGVMSWDYGYDSKDQLTTAVQKTETEYSGVLSAHGYEYDAVGNRTVEIANGSTVGATYNALNQRLSQQPAEWLTFAGHLSEPGMLSIGAAEVPVGQDNQFSARIPVLPGTAPVSLVATDFAGNSVTNQYDISNLSPGRAFTYDLNGNMTSDGLRTFEWDAADRLVGIIEPHRTIALAYGAEPTPMRLTITDGGDVKIYDLLWIGSELVEERSAGVTRHFSSLGMRQGASMIYFTRDHLGNTREVIGSSGQLLSRFDYTPHGKVTLAFGADTTPIKFAGKYQVPGTDLLIFPYRSYDSSIGRWLSRDPLEEQSGEHIYEYSSNNPSSRLDPLGLFSFWSHYFNGGGRPVDLGSVGLLDEFTSSRQVQGIEQQFRRKILRGGRAKAAELCSGKCPDGLVAGTYNVQGSGTADFKTSFSQLWVLGNVRVAGDAVCGLAANCQTRKYNFSCDASFRLVGERFADPLDVVNLVQGEYELPGGKAYAILANWRRVITGTDYF
jgi:RHS repeat-associated protein